LYLLVLLLLPDLLTLELITDQGACAEPESTTNRGPDSGMANSRTNQAASGSSSKCPYAGSFFPCRERASRATREERCYEDDWQ
jgi:hypothetical protein